MIDWSEIDPEEIRQSGSRTFKAGNVERYAYGENGRYLVDIKIINDKPRLDIVFDREANERVWPPKSAKLVAPRRISWGDPIEGAQAVLRITPADLEQLLARADKIREEGFIDVALVR